MQYSVGVEYALHCLVNLVQVPSEKSIGIKELAEFHGISETYLSKIFGKLTKAGIVSSVPGVKGGYKLSKSPEEITFWDVVEAVEGVKPIFQCKNVVEKGVLYKNKQCASCPSTNSSSSNSSCTINLVMLEAEEIMRAYLRNKTIAWLDKELDTVLPDTLRTDSLKYFTGENKASS
ncbi:RrF2 family transcriptional regulator [Neobacillus drentensis]|uniref:RrF2 family transcriptional regulator n=1 Tax=Neobacillus drentensis TaxID=220684 RepID=UPI002FFFB100